MVTEAFSFGIPASLNNNDGSTLYVLGDHFTASSDGSWTGVEWYVPASLSGDNHYILAYQDGGDAGPPLASTLISPIAGGGLQRFLFGSPVAITSGTGYRACVLTNHYVFTSGYTFPHTDGHLTTDGFFLRVTTADEAKYPDGATALNFHVSPVVAFSAPIISGTLAATLGALAATATGLYTAAGTAAAALGALLATNTGSDTVLGTASATLSGLTASGQVSAVVGPRSPIRSQTDTERLAAQTIGGRLT